MRKRQLNRNFLIYLNLTIPRKNLRFLLVPTVLQTGRMKLYRGFIRLEFVFFVLLKILGNPMSSTLSWKRRAVKSSFLLMCGKNLTTNLFTLWRPTLKTRKLGASPVNFVLRRKRAVFWVMWGRAWISIGVMR